MLCRTAENVFWMSRYVERAVAVARVLDVTWNLELDAGDLAGADVEFWAGLLNAPGAEQADEGGALVAIGRHEIRDYLAFDEDNPNSLVSCIRQARTAARGVRESISSEMWEQLNSLYLSLIDPRVASQAAEAPFAFYRRVREGAQFVLGLADCTLARDEPWHFINLGRYLERADNVARALALEAQLLRGGEGARGDELVRWLVVLRSCGSAEAYSRYYSLRVEPALVVEFLLLNPVFPQSVRFCLDSAWEALQGVVGQDQRGSSRASSATRALGRLRARLDHAAVDEILAEGLDSFLRDVQARIAAVCEEITRTYLRDEPSPGRLVAAERAAMIMAAQQQQ
jgi:uncharacterized alpha-E superfamily protein